MTANPQGTPEQSYELCPVCKGRYIFRRDDATWLCRACMTVLSEGFQPLAEQPYWTNGKSLTPQGTVEEARKALNLAEGQEIGEWDCDLFDEEAYPTSADRRRQQARREDAKARVQAAQDALIAAAHAEGRREMLREVRERVEGLPWYEPTDRQNCIKVLASCDYKASVLAAIDALAGKTS